MKKIKVYVVLILMVTTCSLSACSCVNCGFGLRLYENDIFIYTVDYDSGNVDILGLTDIGQQQKFLIIPNTIDGKKVTALGANSYHKKKITEKYGNEKYARFNSNILEKVYIEMEYLNFNQNCIIFGEVHNFQDIYLVKKIKFKETNGDSFWEWFSTINTYTIEKVEFGWGESTKKANISYYYNYDDAENDGYYWIDNCYYGEKIEFIPKNPTREGFEFDGWYKESDCLNKWNFETDVFPLEQLDSEGNIIYQETKLYAKWDIK